VEATLLVASEAAVAYLFPVSGCIVALSMQSSHSEQWQPQL